MMDLVAFSLLFSLFLFSGLADVHDGSDFRNCAVCAVDVFA